MDLLDLLDRPIAFHRPLARLAGSVSAGLLLSQALYWSRRTSDKSGWFWKTQAEWEDETCLTRREQESARALLRNLEHAGRPLWSEERRGVPAKMHYRLDCQVLGALLLRHTSMAKTATLECAKAPDLIGDSRQTITENTNKDYFTNPTIYPAEKKGRIDLEVYGWNELSAMIDKEIPQAFIKRFESVSIEQSSNAFLTYHRDRGTTFADSGALLAAWRGWISNAKGRAGKPVKNAAQGPRGLNSAEIESLRLMGVEV